MKHRGNSLANERRFDHDVQCDESRQSFHLVAQLMCPRGVVVEATATRIPTAVSSTTRHIVEILHPIRSLMLSVTDILCLPRLRLPSTAPTIIAFETVS